MANYDSIDLDWSWDGDFGIDVTGDVLDTSSNFLRSIVNEVQTVIKSESLDWEKDVTLGSDLSDFQGEPNTADTGQAIQDRIKAALVNQGIVQSGDLTVKVVPVHNNQVMIMIRINAEPSTRNGLGLGEQVKVDLVYDTLESGVFFLLDDNNKKQGVL